jgi:hypothetical protein
MESTHEKAFVKPKMAALESVDPYFNQQHLYVGIYSDRGCNFSLRVVMPKEDMKEKANNKEQQAMLMNKMS